MVCPILWASGAWLFLRSPLGITRKIVWTLALAALGLAIGWLLPLGTIRSRFLLLLAFLPVLAAVDLKLARSERRVTFWLRACAFEVCTVFGVAAAVAFLLRR